MAIGATELLTGLYVSKTNSTNPEQAELMLSGGFLISSVYFVLAALSLRWPLFGSIGGLILFVGLHLVNIFFEPSMNLQGIIPKVVIICALVSAIRNSIQYRNMKAAMRHFPSPPETA